MTRDLRKGNLRREFGVVAADSAFIKSFQPNTMQPKATQAQATTTSLKVNGSQQPKAAPVETKSVAPPSKDD